MLNRPTNLFASAARSVRERPWQTDRHPGRRLGGLVGVLVLALVVIAVRLTWVHGSVPLAAEPPEQRFDVAFLPTPTYNGRILASDGTILARDEQRFRVLAHYRWLETPPDPSWLRREARKRPSPGPGRDRRAAAAAAAADLQARRRAMWNRLAALAGVSDDELVARRKRIQRRIERIVDNVEQRRRTRKTVAAPPPDRGSWWQRTWRTVVTTLTTPPERAMTDPVVVQEEHRYHVVLDDLPLAAAAVIEEHPERFPGLEVQVDARRVYPQGRLAVHVVGTRRQATGNDANRSDDIDPGDWIGATGIESSYDRQLRGHRGLERIVTDHEGRVVETGFVHRPRRGRDVVLTLSLPLQRRAEALLDEALEPRAAATADAAGRPPAGGSIVVLDVHSGAVLAAASAPRFDPNVLIAGDARSWHSIVSDPRRPLFPRATRMALPPGSVFKVITTVAILESGVVPPDRSLDCRGYLDHPDRYRCWVFRHGGHGHGATNLSDALCRSCNVYFFDAARRLARRGGNPAMAMYRWPARFGFGRPTGIDLPGEAAGRLPDPPRRPRPSESMQLAIGQGAITATPLQVCRMMAAFANGGYLPVPHVASLAAGQLSSHREQARPIPGLSSETLEQVREGLARVVADPRGTGYRRVRLPGISIAGKTGTAEVGGGRVDHAWFVGYVPVEAPRVAFCVVLEHGGSGGRVAGPIARQLVRAIDESGLIGRQRLTRSD